MRLVILSALLCLLTPLTGCPQPISDDDDATGDDDDATGDDDDATSDDDDATGDDDDATGDDDDATGDDDDATGDDDDATGDDDDATGDDDDATGDDDDATGDDDDATGDDDDATAANLPPTIAFVAPAGGEVADLSFVITWADADPDDDASIELSWDSDAAGFDGTSIAASLSEDDATDAYTWDTSAVPESDVWLYATIDDGINPPVSVYAAGALTIDHPAPPTFAFVDPDGVGDTADASFLATWIDDDPDSNAVIDLFIDNDAAGANGTLLVAGLLEDDATDEYTVDTSGLANGDWWLYAVISDSTTTLTVYSPGPITVAHDPCLVPGGGGVVVVNVPSVDVLIDVTLNGQPVSAANSGDSDEGSLRIVDTATGEIVADLPGVWDDGPDQPLTPYDLQLVVGVYDVYYEVVDDGPNWPSNQNHLLVDGLVIDASGTIVIDVPVADVALAMTLDGAGLGPANTSGTDEGAIELREVGGGGVAYDSPSVWDDATGIPNTPFLFQVVAGDYDVWYQVVDDGPNWPSNTNTLLQAATPFVTGTMNIDVPVSDVSLDITLNGFAVSAANSGDLDEGSVEVRDPNTGDLVIDLAGVWDDGPDQPLTPYTFQIVSGTYALWYDVVDDGPNWPDNETAVLDPAFDFTGDGSFTIDVPSVDVLLDVTLNGSAISAANTGDLNEGSLRIFDPDTGLLVAAPPGVWDDGPDVPLTPYSLQLVGGDYDIYYAVVDDGPDWPSNTAALLEAGYDLSASGTYTIDVPVASVVLDVTLNGQPVSSANSGDLDEGSLVLREVGGTSVAYDSLGVWNDGPDAPLTPFTFQVVAGDYDVWYQVVDDGPNWPDNTNSQLTWATTFTSGTTTIDVGSTDLTIDVTLNGAAVSAANSGDLDEGALQLRDPDTGAIIADFPGVWDDGPDQPLTPYTAQLLDGVYEVYYGVVDDGPNWPDNENAYLVCLDTE